MKEDLYLMKCGHISQGFNKNNKPCCVCCSYKKEAFMIDKKIINLEEGLKNRKAICSACGLIIDSKWDLPFFKYCPNEKYDEYYCGCYGWD